MKKILKWVVIIFVVLFIIGLIFGGDTSEQKTAAPTPTVTSSNDVTTTEVATTNEITPTKGSSLTGPQNNAVRSAEQYISMSGFSRDGLIQQLSSSAGDGYELADATVAVDNLSVDWNEQAARSAKQYLEMSGFSCSGLIEQLSSDAGDKYTVDQANYGAKQAGACS